MHPPPRHGLSRRHCLALAGATALPATLRAQPAWPAKAVRIVVPFAPGGTTDILAPELAKAFVVEFGLLAPAGTPAEVD